MADKPFEFSLSSVLQLREHESEQAQQALMRIVRKRQAQEERVVQARHQVTHLLENRPDGKTGPSALRQYEAHCRAAQHALDAAQDELRRLRDAEAKARNHLTARHQAEEALRTLYDQEAAAHAEAHEQREAKFMDEQAVAGFNRHRNIAGL